jgi:hypothetical protein
MITSLKLYSQLSFIAAHGKGLLSLAASLSLLVSHILHSLSHSYLFIGKNNATSSNLFSTMVAALMDGAVH